MCALVAAAGVSDNEAGKQVLRGKVMEMCYDVCWQHRGVCLIHVRVALLHLDHINKVSPFSPCLAYITLTGTVSKPTKAQVLSRRVHLDQGSHIRE